jgi:hypothetical protein
MGQMALGGSLAPRLLTAPLTVLSPGPRLAGTPSKGKKVIETVATDLADLRLQNGSSWSWRFAAPRMMKTGPFWCIRDFGARAAGSQADYHWCFQPVQ